MRRSTNRDTLVRLPGRTVYNSVHTIASPDYFSVFIDPTCTATTLKCIVDNSESQLAIYVPPVYEHAVVAAMDAVTRFYRSLPDKATKFKPTDSVQ
jgi:hypothetical protein